MRISRFGDLKWLPLVLTGGTINAVVAAIGLAFPAAASAQASPQLHLTNKWLECSFQLDATLTQNAWRQFTGEAGVVTYFKPLADARPMGHGRFEVSVIQSQTGIDDRDAAWNDTFVHPDSTHWLFEGDGLKFPGLALRAGISDRTDVGVYVTNNPNANYGFVGGQIQRNLGHDLEKNWAASARVSFVTMYGPDDLDFSVYGADLLASKTFAVLKRVSISPYAGVSGSVSRSHEKSAVVNLDDESVLGAQATVGAMAQIGMARIGVEYGFARVSSFSIKIGVGHN